jgi:H+/Cl- antiporter ClcA
MRARFTRARSHQRRAARNTPPHELADFSATPRLILISGIALGIGTIAAFVAWLLLRLIGLCTNLFFHLRLDTGMTAITGHERGPTIIVVPVLGGLVIGMMARYGSERIRGHGIPEAIEAILINGSRVDPKVAVLKPVSSAISIGSGGPFGAEGPIIMTGGAFGSLIGGFFHLTAAERKTLLVAGAAAGMSATFGTPVAALMLAVELLLFEWKPRSLIPVGVASAVAALTRHYILGDAPIFPVPEHAAFVGPAGLAGCVLIGLSAGLASLVLTGAVYAAEDAFHRLPIHWMWWPALGGLAIGAGGLIYPGALGVGYDNIRALLSGDAGWNLILGVLIVKSLIWAISLGSGTSGGVLAPLLMIGGALGAVEGHILPAEGAGFWPLIAMAAILGGTMRSPLTGVVFALELTHDVNSLLPLMVAVLCAHGMTVLLMKRSILTEKISRRGYHLVREYSVDPLEHSRVSETMRLEWMTLPGTARASIDDAAVAAALSSTYSLFVVVDDTDAMVGVISRSKLLSESARGLPLSEIAAREPVVAYPSEPLRAVAFRMAETGRTRLPVVSREDQRHVVGLITLTDLLSARLRALHEERERSRVVRVLRPAGSRQPAAEPTTAG